MLFFNSKNWIYFFLLRSFISLRNRFYPRKSQMTKDEFVSARFATRLAFFTAGIATAPWASIVPYVKTRLNLDEIHYASLVLCFGLGAIIGMPLTGKIASKVGVKPIILASIIGLYLGMVGLSIDIISLPFAFLFVLLWGFSLGILDVANNIHAAYLEEQSGRLLMSGFHAWYSVGCIFAAIFCAILLHSGFHTFNVTLLLSALGAIFLIIFFKKLINTKGSGSKELSTDNSSHKSFLSVTIILIGIVCLIMYLTEGMIYDWSSVYLIENAAVDITIASIGYIAFETAIALMRFKGDTLITKFGAHKVIVSGGFIALICFIIIALTHNPYIMVLCFTLSGLSLANLVPVMFSETAKHAGNLQGKAIAFVGTLGYSGLLLGPGVLGTIATYCGLSGMFLFTAGLILILSLIANFVLSKNNRVGEI